MWNENINYWYGCIRIKSSTFYKKGNDVTILARNKIYDMATIESLDRAAREYQRINKKICDAVPGMEWKEQIST